MMRTVIADQCMEVAKDLREREYCGGSDDLMPETADKFADLLERAAAEIDRLYVAAFGSGESK